ncbi:MAG: YbaK/EbsC family protein [Acidimicrobiales bacterium]|nr:YbaK/EbsC family protein [Acidimicrobiales bacterium]MYA26667.1 YbaK/EbsC family protein [Acidimicrobiales bacterium]MYD82227.1 YbaK/EbsC family protein [Acidimicrobiales bacterium]MYG89103.1 YbaK/EbsC family protein [Acidimicrobiales bacterium]MYI26631.1 YbaK/EbsC family protein [Acidimicrobiales bacterium]
MAAAAELGMAPEILRFPEGTRTAEHAAAAVGCELGQIVKSLVFLCDGEPVLALTSGANRVNTKRLGTLLGGKISRADADGVREATGYAIGGTPPFGHAQPLRAVADPALLTYDTVWAAAGTPDTVFELTPGELVKASGAEVAEFAAD